MTVESVHILLSIAIGLGATLVMDLWLFFRKHFFNVSSLNYCFLGRWILHMPEGVFRHPDIALAGEKAWECAVGRVAHYAIGAMFGVLLVLFASPSWLQQPTLLPAVIWGLLTVSAPLFLMQPAFGLGIAASKLPNRTQVRLQSLLTHTIFGIGLYLSGWVVSHIL